MKVIMDANFVVSCVKKRIDFLDELESLGFVPVIPKEVLQELKDLRLKVAHDTRVAIDLAVESLNGKGVKKITLGKKKTDEGLIAKGKEGMYIATLDNAVKRVVPNKVVIANASNSLVIERN